MTRTITLQIKCGEFTCGECDLGRGFFCRVFKKELHDTYLGDEYLGIGRCQGCLMADVEFMKEAKKCR